MTYVMYIKFYDVRDQDQSLRYTSYLIKERKDGFFYPKKTQSVTIVATEIAAITPAIRPL